ncbi:MAG: 1-(5-phosphoribosyl)-5-[(5-phosphoribosylamino)methylideneamino]imidazole-4-carboxamide isomerase [Bacteroidota bacterium]
MITVIPAIDIIDGKCVRLTRGDYSTRKVYSEDPLEMALQFEGAGLKRLHLVDLDGAKAGKVINLKVAERLAAHTGMTIDFSGGIKTDEDLVSVFGSGIAMVTIGSAAVKDPERFFSWVDRFGADKIILGADVKEEKIAVSGWTEETSISVMDFIGRNMQRGVKQVLCTDISKDGMLGGSADGLYRKISSGFPGLYLIASGGVASVEDIRSLERSGCKAVVVGKAIYEGRISLTELASC